jgi:tetratricopeptide (TPR) repeat protein
MSNRPGIAALLLSGFMTFPIAPAAQLAAPSFPTEFPKEAYVFELLETKVRFESDGKGSRELTGRIRIQSESATHEFGLLRFPYASTFESLSIDYVRVRKPDGTVVVTPASDIQDVDSEVSRQAPMYTDEREKHVAVKTLMVGDVLEYHAIWNIHDAPAPGHFWFEGDFIRNAICLDETLELDVPRDLPVKFSSSSEEPVIKDSDGRRHYKFHHVNLAREEVDSDGAWERGVGTSAPPAIRLTSFQSWDEVGKWFGELAGPQMKVTPQVQAKADELAQGKTTNDEKIRALYEFVSLNFRYIGISLGQGRYTPHRAEEVLANRYGDCKDKHTLFAALLAAEGIKSYPALISTGSNIDVAFPSPSLFDHLITAIPQGDAYQFVDTTPEIDAYGYLVPGIRDKQALVIVGGDTARLVKTPANAPSANLDSFKMDATLDSQGTLEGKARIESQGDTEVALRLAFRGTSESRWNELAQNIVSRIGFGGTVSDVSVAQPTAVAFWFSYAYERPEYSDWKNHQTSVPLPVILMPVIAEKRRGLADPVELGSPMELTYEAKVTLPKGIRPTLPPSTDLKQDFGTYTARYSLENGVLSGSRHLKMLMREIPGSERETYSAFVESMLEEQSRFMPFNGETKWGGMPGAGGHSENEEAQHLYDQSFESIQLGAPYAAIGALERVVKLEPEWGDAWLLLGDAQLIASRADQGIQSYQKAVALEPANETGRRVLALALAAAHRDGEAIEAWREVLRIKPQDSQAGEKLRTSLLKAKKYKEAIPYLEDVAPEKRDTPEIQRDLGEAYLGVGQEKESMVHYRKAMELDPGAEMLNSVAYALAEAKQDLDDAQRFAEEAVKKTEEETTKPEALDTKNLTLVASLAAEWDTLGWVKFQRGDYANAAKYLESAWALMQAPIIGDHLGQSYEKSGNKRQAARTYALALSALGRNGDPSLRQKMSARRALLAAEGAKFIKDGGAELSEMRTYRVATSKGWEGGYRTAQVGVSISTEQPTILGWFLNGADELKATAAELPKVNFRIKFPDDGPTRIVERGILSCSEASKACTLVLLPILPAGGSIPVTSLFTQ